MTSTSASVRHLADLSQSAGQVDSVDEGVFADDGGDESYDDTSNSRRNPSDMSCVCPEVYMSLVWHGGHLGVAHYDLSSLQIHVMVDKLENDDFSLLKQIVREVQPTVIVLSSLNDSRLLACLRRLVSEKSPVSPGSNTDICKLEFLPNSDFSYEVSKRRILSMKLPSVPKHFTDEERKFYFASLISPDSTNMVRAVGGLLKYLDKTRVGVELEDVATSITVLGFRVFTLLRWFVPDTTDKLVDIARMDKFCELWSREEPNPDRYNNLLCPEYLPYGAPPLCVQVRMQQQQRRPQFVWQWFLRPLRNASMLRQRYDALTFFLTPQNMEIVNCLQGCLKQIKYIPRILLRMTKAQATIGDWVALYRTIYHAVYIGDTCRSQTQSVEIFRKIGIAFTDDLHRSTNLIRKTIDFEASKQSKRFVVQAHVDDKLDEKKRTFNGLPDLMSRVAREELESLNDDITECVVSYLPQIGYLLVIDMPEGKTEADDHTVEGLDYKFSSNNQLFYKSPKTLELDRILGDIQLEITDLEVTIMHHLQDAILESTQVLLDVMELAAELDCLMGLAACASEFGYVRPNLVEENVIDIKAGRHALQELCCSPYVPNDTTMGGCHSKVKLLTGPNACGKSIYLKQVALIVFMAHIGSFVPAEQASIGSVDQMFSRIKCMESVSGGLSTFMQDSMQISEALQSATSNSLVIVDEFGKGTETTDGQALLTAVLKFWIAKGSSCPFVLVSTHFHSIIQQRLLPQSTQLQYLTLETVMNGEELVFLYQLKEGHTSTSCAGNIALQVGMPLDIIKRASEVSDLLSQNKTVPHLKDSNSSLQSQRHERIVSAFSRLNLDMDDLHAFLRGFVLQACTDPPQRCEPAQDKEQAQCVPQVSDVSHEGSNNFARTSRERRGRENEDRTETVSNETGTHKVKDGTTEMRTSSSSMKQQGALFIQGQSKDLAKAKVGSESSEGAEARYLFSDMDRHPNISQWRNERAAHLEQFSRTPLVEKNRKRTVSNCSLSHSKLPVKGSCTNTAQDLGKEKRNQTEVLNNEADSNIPAGEVVTTAAQGQHQTAKRHTDQHYTDSTSSSKRNDAPKRKADMSFLFNSESKQARPGTLFQQKLRQAEGGTNEKTPANAVGLVKQKEKSRTSSSTAQPDSETTSVDLQRHSASEPTSAGSLMSSKDFEADAESSVLTEVLVKRKVMVKTSSSSVLPESDTTSVEEFTYNPIDQPNLAGSLRSLKDLEANRESSTVTVTAVDKEKQCLLLSPVGSSTCAPASESSWNEHQEISQSHPSSPELSTSS